MEKEIAIDIIDLHYSYPDGNKALDGVNLKIFKNEKTAIVGPNGAGKSTLLMHLNGVKRGQGQIIIDSFILNDKNLREIRKKVGLVFQNPEDQLFCPTVFDDIAFGPLNMRYEKDEIIRRVKNALKFVELEGFEEKSPFHLSEGEKKRISLATVLALDPEILVFDEPTSNLDPSTRKHFIELLSRFERTIIVATHDLDFVLDFASRCIILNKGKIIADNKPEILLKDRETLLKNGLELPLSLKIR
jgi:cobalt/nickel transport system ATP-binding protein